MKQSLTYYLVLFVLRLKGIKSMFRADPIDFKKLRKGDMHQAPKNLSKRYDVQELKILNSKVTEIKQKASAGKLLLFIHGGAFISGPEQHHWDSSKAILEQTNHDVWMCDYPKAPETQIAAISSNIDQIYQTALARYEAKNIICIGDSVGGNLIATLIQRLIQNKAALPAKIILISPVMDASFTNPEIDPIDKIDPILSKAGVLSAKKMCAGDIELKSNMMSPLYGNFEGFPTTIIYVATHDITYPDQILAIQKLKQAHIDHDVIEGENMPHIWPLLPIMKESKIALKLIISQINS